MRTFLFLVTVILVPFASSNPAAAWSGIGHKVICQIAYEDLNPPIKARVDALIVIDPKFRTFADACTWPDMFPRQRRPEHYVNLPRSAPGLDAAHPCPEADRCVVTAILSDARDLAFASDVMEQLRHLKSLGHWVGDIHQPFHVSFGDDRGGNFVGIAGPCRNSLHAVWDICIIKSQFGTDYAAIASQLRSEITAEDRAHWLPGEVDMAAVVSWANESFEIVRKPDVGYCVQKSDGCWYAADQKTYSGGAKRAVRVNDAYLAAQADMVRKRLKMAGVRLGSMLNTVLAVDEHGGR